MCSYDVFENILYAFAVVFFYTRNQKAEFVDPFMYLWYLTQNSIQSLPWILSNC